MLTFIILVFSITLLVFVLHRRLRLQCINRVKICKSLSDNGLEASAILLSMQTLGVRVDNVQQVELQMQVQPAKGRNFVVEAKEELNEIEIERLRIGSTLKVKYNPANTSEVMLISK